MYVFSPGSGSTIGFDDLTLLGTAVIPEPTTLALPALGGLGLLRRRRRVGVSQD